MQPPKTKALVDRLRAAYHAGGQSLATLSAQLGGIISSQGLTEVFGGRANPTSEQTLAILEFLKDKSMDINITGVRTLFEAKEKILELTEKLKLQATQAPVVPDQKAPTPTPTPRPVAPTLKAPLPAPRTPPLAGREARNIECVVRPVQQNAPPFDPSELPGWEAWKAKPPTPLHKIPAACCSPYLITEYIKVLPFDTLLSALSNSENSVVARTLCYQEAKLRRSLGDKQ